MIHTQGSIQMILDVKMFAITKGTLMQRIR